MRMRQFSRPLLPTRKNGHLYYVRLKTPLGIFYKLGFTTLDSVEKRLAYQGKGDEAFIDSILCFAYLDDAFDVETELHAHFYYKAAFGNFSAAPDMPLCGNGQSELYYEDILGMDDTYMQAQSEHTRSKVRLAGMMRHYQSEHMARKRMQLDDALERVVLTIALPLRWIFLGIGKVIDLCLPKKQHAQRDTQGDMRYKAHIENLLARIRSAEKERQERLWQENQERLARSNELHRLRLKHKVETARTLLTQKDLEDFEQLLDDDRF